jgi:hypothetical protein
MTHRAVPASIGTLTLAAALADRHLLGGLPQFRDLASWQNWIVFSKALDGFPLSPEEQITFCRFTGRAHYAPPPGGWWTGVLVTARQTGKTEFSAKDGAIEALKAEANEYVLLFAQDQRASLRTLFKAACEPFDRIPLFADRVRARRAESLELDNGAVIAAYPCRPQAPRGLRARRITLDEFAFYRNSENLPVDREMLTAVRPCLATTNGKLLIVSSPYAQTGVLYELHRRAYGTDDPTTLVWQAGAIDMNPTLPADYLRRMEADDPDAYRSEVLGEFRGGVSTFFDPAALQACVEAGVRERPPERGRRYVCGVDPSGGRGDKFAVAIAHRDGARAVLDVVRTWAPPFNPSGVIAEAGALIKAYGTPLVFGDRYGAEFNAEQFRAQEIVYRMTLMDRSGYYLALLPLVNSERVVLLDRPDLLREARGLERRRGSAGRDRVDHPPGQHDDAINAAAIALAYASGRRGAALEDDPGADTRTDGEWGEKFQRERVESYTEHLVSVTKHRGVWFPGD